MSQANLFSRRAILGLVAAAALSLGVGAVLALDGPTPPTEAPVPSTASRAATGHRALLNFVRALGYPVRTTPVASNKGVLLILEPELDAARPDTARRLGDHALGADRVLVVLPKWRGVADPEHPGWLKRVEPLPVADVASALTALAVAGSLERHEGNVHLHSRLGQGEAEIERPQLLKSNDLEPLVSGPEGMLVGERVDEDGSRLIVVADPDLLSNHGLRRGDNAAIVAALLEKLTDETKGLVVFDESLIPHGQRNLLGGLLHFPTVLAALQLLVCLGLLLWAGLLRFGAPLPEAALGPRGAMALVEGAVALQLRAGSALLALRSLLDAAVRDVSERLHVPAGLKGAALEKWFETRAAAFGQRDALRSLRQQVFRASDTRRVVAAAQAVQRWRKRMVHGTR
jgi:hypothetical protein